MRPTLATNGHAIVTPFNVPVKTPRVMARKKFDRLCRDGGFARRCGFLSLFVCLICKQPARILHDHAIIAERDESPVHPRTESFRIECVCSVWTVNA